MNNTNIFRSHIIKKNAQYIITIEDLNRSHKYNYVILKKHLINLFQIFEKRLVIYKRLIYSKINQIP